MTTTCSASRRRGAFIGQPGRERFDAHAYRPLDLKPEGPGQEVDLALLQGCGDPRPHRRSRGTACPGRLCLQPGPPRTHGRLAAGRSGGPAGARPRPGARRPLRPARARSRSRHRGPRLLPRTRSEARRDGPVLGSRSAANGPVTVRLEPCGTARCRFVAPDGKPLDRLPIPRLIAWSSRPGRRAWRTWRRTGPCSPRRTRCSDSTRPTTRRASRTTPRAGPLSPR